MRRPAALALAAAAAFGVASGLAAEAPRDVDWRRIATPRDRERLRGWREAWVEAKTMSSVAGADAAMAAEPQLLDPDRALPGAALAPGTYRCRTLRLGGLNRTVASLIDLGPANCTVAREGSATRFAMDGTMRASGYLFDNTDSRQIFLGTLAVGDERRAMRYGRDGSRDMAGFVERIGKQRWRLVLPYPAFASTLDVVEIVPAG